MELDLASEWPRLSSPSRQRWRLPRNRSSASAFAAPAERCSSSAATVIAGRSTVVTPAANPRGVRSAARLIADINKHCLAGWPIAGGNTPTAGVAPARAITASERCLRTAKRK